MNQGVLHVQVLLNDLKKGEISAFDQLYFNFHSKLYAFCFKLTNSREESEEIVHDVFLKIWDIRELLDEQKNFEGLIFTIAKNLIYNKAKKQVIEFSIVEYAEKFQLQFVNDILNQMEYEETKNIIERLISKLPPKRKEIFLMSRTDGLSNKEIARKLNTSVSNVENQINKALKFIRKFYLISLPFPIITALLI